MKNRLLFLVFALCLTSSAVFAQWTGPTSVTQFTPQDYIFTTSTNYPDWYFLPIGGQATVESHVGSQYRVTVYWTDVSTTNKVNLWRYNSVTGVWSVAASLTVNVSAATPPTPSGVSMSQTQHCGYTTVSRNASPPAGAYYSWYWQESASGQSTSSPGSSFNASVNNAQYWLRARSDSPPYNWSTSSLYMGSVSVISLPGAPGVTSPITYCQEQIATPLSASGSNLRWYTTQFFTPGTGSTTAPTPSTASAGSTTYWVTQTVNGCEGPATSITVNVIAKPSAPGVTTPVNYCQGSSASQLSAPGSNLLWYTVSSGGSGSSTAPTPSTSSTGTTYYYVSQTVNGCESNRSTIAVNVYAIPSAPSVTSPVSYCHNASTSQLSASGSNLKWYTVPVGGASSGTAPTPSSASVGTQTYYVSQTTNGCESSRSTITVNIYAIPSAPSATSPVNYCHNAATTALTASGSNLKWYTVPSGGTGSSTALTPSSSSTGTTYYYVSQTTNGCESSRTWVAVNVYSVPSAPTVSSPVNYCVGSSASALSASGSNLLWYTVSSGGTGSSTAPTPSTGSAGTTNYYVSQTQNGCESSRATIAVNVYAIPSAPTVTSPVNYCHNASTVALTATGSNLKWYTVSSGGTGSSTAPTPSSSTVGSTNHYVSQTVNGCESSRATITVNVYAIPSGPSVSSPVTYCQNASAVALSATGSNLLWYTVSSGGTGSGTAPTPLTTSAGTTNYYVTQTVNGCTSAPRTELSVVVNATPSAPTATTAISYCQNASATALTATGSNLLWYTTSSGGTGSSTAPTPSTSSAGTTSYYVSQTISGCEGPRTQINVTINTLPAAPTASNTSVCTGSSTSVSATPAANSSIAWFDLASWGTQLGTGNSLATPTLKQTTTYYAQSVHNTTSCVSSSRTAVTATVISKPSLPTGIADQVIFGSGSATLNATPAVGTDQVKWYTAPTGGSPVYTGNSFGTPTLSVTTYYYISSYITSPACEGAERTPVSVIVTPATIPASVVVETIRNSGTTTDLQVYALNNTTQKTTQVTYFDGLMRPHQQVSVASSPAGADMISFSEYDANGRSSKNYLPYVATTATGDFRPGYATEQTNFYNASNDKIANDASPFAESLFEDSPLGRPLKQGSVGADWQLNTTHVKSLIYTFNVSGDNVRRFNSDGTSSSFYAANKLFKSVITNEHGNQVVTFTDDLGRTILQRTQLDETINGNMVNWLETYSIYDDFGRIKYTISPKAVAELQGNGWSLTQTIKDQYVYEFKYDQRGRVTEKKVPGSAWIYYIYDDANRLVLMQDGLLRNTNQWMFIKYDELNRTIQQGLYTNTVNTTHTSLQTIVEGISPGFEKRGSTLHGYTNVSFPTTNQNGSALDVLSVSYYDNHDFDNSGTADFSYVAQGLTGEVAPTAATAKAHGLATGSKRKVLGTNTWLYTYVFYDSKGRAVQVRSDNHLSANQEDLATSVFDFEGKLLRRKVYHKAGVGKETTIYNEYEYDAKGRLVKVKQKHNSDPSYQTLARYEYNELGQLVDKKLHDTGGENYLQSVDYRYTIRGQIETINNAELTVQSSNNDETNDYFGLSIAYNAVESALGNTAYYDGNISAIRWKGPGVSNSFADRQSYKFTYDKADRLKSAQSQMSDGTNWNQQVNALNEAITYDHNGNILNLTRNQDEKGLSVVNNLVTVTHAAQTIDNLTYTYSLGNPLSKVEDATGHTRGFTNGSTATTEYSYDVNGNVTEDKNKGITNIVYNFLGKPTQMTFSDGKVINYVYDAAGSKLSMSVTKSGVTTTTDYAGNFVYENGNLSFFGSPEGRVVKNGSNLEYQYNIADHQGNTRVVFTSATPSAQTISANFESSTNNNFLNYPASSPGRNSMALYNRTAGGTSSQFLNGSTGYQIGVAKTYKVVPGDKVKIEAYAKYLGGGSGGSSNIAGFAAALLSAFSLPLPAPGEVHTPSAGLNSYGGLVANGSGPGGSASYPKVFVNILLFDKDHNFLDVAYQQIDGGEQIGVSPNVAHDYMMSEYTVKEAGYAYVYVSNESATLVDAYFDDVAITYTPTNILQYSEYYPFGLQTNNSWTRENTSNNYLYNEGNELNPNSGWYETFFRGYDPALGRFLQVDPLSFSEQATYQYAANNPVYYTDPTGAFAFGSMGRGTARYERMMSSAGWSIDAFGNVSDGKVGGGGMHVPGTDAPNYNWASDLLPEDDAIYRDYMLMSRTGFWDHYDLYDNWIDWFVNGKYVDSQFMGHTIKKKENEDQKIPTVDQFIEFANFFFGKQAGMIKQRAPLKWKIGGFLPGRKAGLTTKEKDGSVLIRISLEALLDPKLLYHTIGHELVHADDLTNGNYEKWVLAVNKDGWVEESDRNFFINAIMEHHAYMWDAAEEEKFGTDYGAKLMLRITESSLEPWGYLSLFEK